MARRRTGVSHGSISQMQQFKGKSQFLPLGLGVSHSQSATPFDKRSWIFQVVSNEYDLTSKIPKTGQHRMSGNRKLRRMRDLRSKNPPEMGKTGKFSSIFIPTDINRDFRTRNADITLEDESSGDEFPDSASVAAAKKADSKAPNYRPRPFRASHNDTRSRVSGRSIEVSEFWMPQNACESLTLVQDQPPWTGILTAIQNASDANWRLNNLKQFVTSLVAIIQCPADPTQGQGNRSTQNQETSQSSVAVSQAPPQRYKRTISNDNNSGDERDDEDRRKRRFNQTPSDSHTINFLQIPCPFSKNIPGKLTRKRKNGPTPTQQPVLCKQEFESMEELRYYFWSRGCRMLTDMN